MSTTQAFILGLMVAYTPSLLYLAIVLWQMREPHTRSRSRRQCN